MWTAIKQAFLVGVALLGIGVASRACAEDTPVTISRTYKLGSTHRYQSTQKVTALGKDTVITRTFQETVKKVTPQGDVTLLHTEENGKISTAGAEDVLSAGPPLTIVRDRYGKLLEWKAPNQDEQVLSPDVQRLIAMVGDVLLTDKPVKPGDTWQTELQNPVDKQKFVVKDTFVSKETVDGIDLWKIHQTMEATVDVTGHKLSQDETVWLSVDQGQITHIESTYAGIPSQYGPLSFSSSMKMLPAEPGSKTK